MRYHRLGEVPRRRRVQVREHGTTPARGLDYPTYAYSSLEKAPVPAGAALWGR